MLSIAHSLGLPRICLVCQMQFKDPTPLCKACELLIPRLKNTCMSCAEPSTHSFCGRCRQHGSVIHRLYVFYPYQQPLTQLIKQFKFGQSLDLNRYLAQLLLNHLPTEALKTQCLIPIPMHPQKLRQRGFHQTALLTKQLSKKTGIPYQLNLCKKTINTVSQSSLTRLQRKSNLEHAFTCQPIQYQHITLIDDVITTGSTLQTLANLFQQQGVLKIDAWVLCKS